MKSPDKPTGAHLWLVLWKAYKSLEAYDLASIDSLGLGGLSDFALLEVLLHKGAQPVNAIGRRVGLTSGSMTAAVDRAEKKGLVRRQASRMDRRVVEVHLTEEGRAIITKAFTEHAKRLETATRSLSARDKEDLLRLLKKWGKSAAVLPHPPQI